jgi:hypothetical protein
MTPTEYVAPCPGFFGAAREPDCERARPSAADADDGPRAPAPFAPVPIDPGRFASAPLEPAPPEPTPPDPMPRLPIAT